MADGTENDTPVTPKTQGTADVHAGILAVMASLGTLSKEHKNKFDNYDYASIDDFIAFVRADCFKAGIWIEQDETEAKLVDVSKKDGKPMAVWWARYAFTVRHIGGTFVGPIHRSVMVQASGAQSSGSAMAYALKQFMRSTFLIPTGDKDDPDKDKIDISAERGDKETDLQRKASSIRRQLLRAPDVNECKLVWSDNAVDIDHIKRVSDTAFEFLEKEYKARIATLEAKDDAQ